MNYRTLIIAAFIMTGTARAGDTASYLWESLKNDAIYTLNNPLEVGSKIGGTTLAIEWIGSLFDKNLDTKESKKNIIYLSAAYWTLRKLHQKDVRSTTRK